MALDTAAGSELLSSVGFLHVPGRPLFAGTAYLFVALRRRPTLEHFDPERVDYWRTEACRGVRALVERASLAPGQAAFSWGVIKVVDRKAVANDFVSFGGVLSVRRFDEVDVAVFSSDAPIAASGGHSQGWDPCADEMLAFIARLRAAAGASRQIESRLNLLRPLGVYSAYIADSIARHRDPYGAFVDDWRLIDLLTREQRKLVCESGADWADGEALARRLA